MLKINIEDFVVNYSLCDREYLDLKWNGKFGPKYKDENHFFRLQVLEQVILDPSKVEIQLLRELFICLGRSAQLNFYVHPYFCVLAQELLQRGGKEFLFEYVCAAHISYDTFTATADIKLDCKTKAELLQYFDYLKTELLEPSMAKLFVEPIRNRFV
ncbi:hypothetical protein [Myroides sp. LJL119]